MPKSPAVSADSGSLPLRDIVREHVVPIAPPTRCHPADAVRRESGSPLWPGVADSAQRHDERQRDPHEHELPDSTVDYRGRGALQDRRKALRNTEASISTRPQDGARLG